MKQLKRQDYKKFVEQHILRPFQGMISDQEKAIDFSLDWYNAIPLLVEDNDDLQEAVFSRISKIFDSIDGDYLPDGPAGMCILNGMQHHGVKIKQGY